MNAPRTIDQVLDLARWAPSGDNTQPWAFEVVDEARAVVHGHDTRDHCVYDLDGRASQMSLGALLETAAIAASALGHRLSATLRGGSPPTRPTFDLLLQADDALPADPLARSIEKRSVQRRPYRTTALTGAQKARLESALGPGHAVRWVEGASGRARMAMLLFRSARLRLVTQEAYQVHRDVIEWDARYSVDRVPDQALGVGRPMIALMRFAMASWERVQFFNRFLAGTWMPRLQMDLLPAWACGAHFLIAARTAPTRIEDQVAAGRAMQRFWLTATDLGLAMQPELTPLIFGRYAREGRPFSRRPGSLADAGRVADGLESLLGPDALGLGVFMGRLGRAPEPTSRSLRKPLDALSHPGPEAGHG
jgi:nitroreductase